MTLVLVHGLGLTSNIWSPLVSILDEKNITYSLPGHENCSLSDFSWSGILKGLKNKLKQKSKDSFTFVLHSFAGALLPEIVRSDLKIKRIIFIESVLHIDDAVWTKELSDMSLERYNDWLSKFRSVSEITLRSQLIKKQTQKNILLWSEGFRITNGTAIYAMASNLTKRLLTDEIENSLKEASLPILYLRGSKSRLSLTGKKFVESCGVTIMNLPESGHFPMLDNPSEIKNIIDSLLD